MRYLLIIFLLLVTGVSFSKNHIPKSIYEFKYKGLKGEKIDFADFKGKKILLVNTTALQPEHPQFNELENLAHKYKNKLVVVGFLTPDYATPPGSTKDVSHLDRSKYHVTFPLTAPIICHGDNTDPIYLWLTDSKYNHYKTTEMKWDFQKYLINEKGELIAEFDPKISVTEPQVIQAIEQ